MPQFTETEIRDIAKRNPGAALELAFETMRESSGSPSSARVEITSESGRDICSRIVALLDRGARDPENARPRSAERAGLICDNLNRILPVLNTNTVDVELKRTVILQTSLRKFALRILPLSMFSTVFNGVRLEGTDKVAIPFYDLESAASIDFDDDEGYQTGDSTNSVREVTIDKRKYQSLAWNSKTLRRQPYFQAARSMELKAEKLGADVFADVASIITAVNFGAAVFTGASSTFDSDDVADLKLAAKTWPEGGRSLMVDSAYDAHLLKDTALKNSLSFGDEAIRQGHVRRLFGFDYYENPNIPSNAENLVGWINFVSAILVATAPIAPSDEVRNQLTAYEVITDPTTGISFEYRRWGSADMDESREVVEANYGYAKGNEQALQRLVSA